MTKTKSPGRPAPSPRAKMSPKVKHEKLHVKRGIVMPGCKWCVPEPTVEETTITVQLDEKAVHALSHRDRGITMPGCSFCVEDRRAALDEYQAQPREGRIDNYLKSTADRMVYCEKHHILHDPLACPLCKQEVLEDIPVPDTSTSGLVEECRIIAEQLDNTLYQDYAGLVPAKPKKPKSADFTLTMVAIAASVMWILLVCAIGVERYQAGVRSQAPVVQAAQKHTIAAEKEAITALSERDQAQSKLDDLKGQYEVAVAMLKGALEQLQKQAQYITGDRRWHAQDDAFWKKYHGRTVIVDPVDSAKDPGKEWRADPGIQYSVDDFVGSQGKKKQ